MTRFFNTLGRFSVRFHYPIVQLVASRLSRTDRVPSLPLEPEAERAATPW